MTASTHDSWTHHEATVNGVRLHYVQAGQGPLVNLLHGFPEFWYSWRHQIPAIAEAGYRVVAPDTRGYNRSDRPPGVRSYWMEALVGDVVGLIQHVGEDRATLVGHEWGGAIAWSVAMRSPEVVDVLNAQHPGAFLRELRTPGQLLRSWYMLFFQLPWIPEAAYRLVGQRLLRRTLLNDPIRPGAFSEQDINRYLEAIGQPGALTSAINYYRAMFRLGPRKVRREISRIDNPTLLIWGERDRYLGIRLTEGLESWIPNIRVERIPNASHWVQNDVPGQVNELLIRFLQET